ncbi:unnamed protein product [Gongylonema pulchrum]|uniref:Cation_ATPase_C domain-containing protein n=1 Tax=Gongylonema pulchrum TaxID=637853 RepID=A0A183DEY5_9BILA|nr:unnamed protein product [Gongylonema pulchrum]
MRFCKINLLMALVSFFEVMYWPLSMIQSFTTWSSPFITYYSVLIALSAAILFFQFFQRSIIEEMLPHMQYSFK